MGVSANRIPRGLGLVYYFQHRSFILEQLEQGYPVSQIYRDLQSKPSNDLLPCYRQLFKLIYTYDRHAARFVSYHKDRADVRSISSISEGNTPEIVNSISAGKVPKKSDALKPTTFNYNPRAYKLSDL